MNSMEKAHLRQKFHIGSGDIRGLDPHVEEARVLIYGRTCFELDKVVGDNFYFSTSLTQNNPWGPEVSFTLTLKELCDLFESIKEEQARLYEGDSEEPEGELVLFVVNDCPVCDAITTAFKYYIDKNILKIFNVDDDDMAKEMFDQMGLTHAPTILMLVDENYLVGSILPGRKLVA